MIAIEEPDFVEVSTPHLDEVVWLKEVS